MRSFVLATAMVLLPVLGTAHAQNEAEIQTLLDERELIRIVDAIDDAVDLKDWPRARSYFADEVHVDFSSLGGPPPATIPSDQLIAGWNTNLTAAKTSLHLRTNHLVTIDGDNAVVTSHGYAWNRMEGNGDPLWETWGHYEHRLERRPEGWRVVGMTYRQTHERGNPWVKTTVPE
jgi:hypothetical protein